MREQSDAVLARARDQRAQVLRDLLRRSRRSSPRASRQTWRQSSGWRRSVIAGAVLGCVLLELRAWPAGSEGPPVMRTGLAAALASGVILLLWTVAMLALHAAPGRGRGRAAPFADEEGPDGGAGASMVDIGKAIRGESRPGGSGEEKSAMT